MTKEQKAAMLVEVHSNFTVAAEALRKSWWLLKSNGLTKTATQVADTVLDVENSTGYIEEELRDHFGVDVDGHRL